MKARVLVTGAAGAVGEETVRELVDHGGFEVVALDLPTWRSRRRLRPFRKQIQFIPGDLCKPDDVARATEGVQAVIHLAALIPPRADHEPRRATEVNEHGTANLVSALERLPQPPRLLHTSSISVYGDRLKDHWIQVGDPLQPSPHDHYARTKIQGEKLVQGSRDLPWTIFRLTGVMSRRVGMDPLMFHMPLDTHLEIITAADTARALVRALETDGLEGRIFNLGGGPRCRGYYREYLDRHLSIMGLGTGFFPDGAFAEGNFHCGYYRDSTELDELLGFQQQGLDEWFEQVRQWTNPAIPVVARALRPLIRSYLLSQSEPLAARRMGDSGLLERFAIRASL